jgi:hypothetical protein
MAKQSPLAYLPEVSGQERPDTNVQTEEALNTLLEALERRREKPMFDPVGLATAGGFMKPTKTGSGFEALSNAIEAYTGARQGERQREIEDAQQYLGVVGQLSEIERRKRRDKQFQGSLGMGPKTTLGKAPGTSPAEEEINVRVPKAAAYAPPGFEGQAGTKVGPENPNYPSREEFMQGAMLEGKMDYSEALLKAAELERNRYHIGTWGAYDKRTGFLFEFPKGDLVERQIFGSTYKIPSTMASQLDFYQFQGDRENYNKIANRALNREEVPSTRPSVSGQKEAPSTRPSALAQPARESGGLKSESQKAIDLERQKTLATELAKTEAEQQTAIVNEGRRAGPTITLSNQLVQLASAPDANEIYGLARNDQKFMAILTDMIGSGIQLGGGYSVSVPVLSDIYRTFKFTPDQQQRYQYALQKFREMAIKMSEFAKGSVSNYEQTLFSQASVNENDLPGTIRMKAEAMKVRAEFEKERAALLRSKDANGKRRFSTTDDLYDSAEYENIVAKLDKKYEAILKQNGMLGQAREVAPAQRDSNNPTFPEVKDFQERLQQRRSQQ